MPPCHRCDRRHPVCTRQGNAQKAWAAKLLERKSARLVSVALANKTARTAWAVLARNQSYVAPAM
jgi:transposase